MNVQVKKMASKTQQRACLLSKDIYDELEMHEGRTYKLKMGQRSTECLIRPEKSEHGCAWLSETLYDELLFYETTPLNIWKRGRNICLGPVVGMIVPSGCLKEIRKGQIPESVAEHVQLAGSCEHCLSYCFSMDNVDWEKGLIKGFVFNKRLNIWRERWLPMPDAAYDRNLFFDKKEKNLACESWKLRMKSHGVKFINRHTNIGRWKVYEHLSKYEGIHACLPETILYASFEDVLRMLEKYESVCFKPSTVSQDKESIVIRKEGERYEIKLDKGKFVLGFSYGIQNLKMLMDRFVEEKRATGRKNFIIQQGISPMEQNGSKLIVRMLMEKNEHGKREVTRCHATSDGEGSFEKHHAESYERMCSRFGCSSEKVAVPTQEELISFAMKIAALMEKDFGDIGEMEMKMAVDVDGKAWFLESNLKPDKYRIPEVDGQEDPLPEALAIYKYAIWLSRN